MEKRVFAKMTRLPNVVGRVDYISNPKRQENLLAFYQTMDNPQEFWKALSNQSQVAAAYNKAQMEEHNRREEELFAAGKIKSKKLLKTVEARELMLCLPNDIYGRYDLNVLAQVIAKDIKERHNIDCAVAVHLNKKRTNLHAHCILPERLLLETIKESIATRNTYYDAQGKRSNKKDCVDENGALLPGCRMVKKGELLNERHFGEKNPVFANKGFVYGEKVHYAKIFNQMSRDNWVVYSHYRNPHMRLYSIKRGEPEALSNWKEVQNRKLRLYNAIIDEMMKKNELTSEQALAIKESLYIRRAEERAEKLRQREEWMCWRDQIKKEEYEKTARQERKITLYDKGGRKRSLLELLIILSLQTAGVDILKNHEIDENIIVHQKTIKATVDINAQNKIDQIAIAAGREAPSISVLKNRIARLQESIEQTVDMEEKVRLNIKQRELEEKIAMREKELSITAPYQTIEKSYLR